MPGLEKLLDGNGRTEIPSLGRLLEVRSRGQASCSGSEKGVPCPDCIYLIDDVDSRDFLHPRAVAHDGPVLSPREDDGLAPVREEPPGELMVRQAFHSIPASFGAVYLPSSLMFSLWMHPRYASLEWRESHIQGLFAVSGDEIAEPALEIAILVAGDDLLIDHHYIVVPYLRFEDGEKTIGHVVAGNIEVAVIETRLFLAPSVKFAVGVGGPTSGWTRTPSADIPSLPRMDFARSP